MDVRWAKSPDGRRRNSLRAGAFDYATPGAYFVTICLDDRQPRFGDVVEAVMCHNDAGRMIANAWQSLPARFPHICVDIFVVMPNHLHGIIDIVPHDLGNDDRADGEGKRANTRFAPTSGRPTGPRDGSLSRIIQAFKSITTREYSRGVRECGWEPFDGRLWQRSFYDHIIRDDRDLRRIHDYIQGNPAMWAEDRLYREYVASLKKKP